MKNRMIRLLAALTALLGIGLSLDSCRDPQLTDETEFNLYYPGVTDIAPSATMSVDIPVGAYIGAKPTDFKITRVTFEGGVFDNASGTFSINSEGTVHIANSDQLEIGQYAISISCQANGKTWDFPDIITVNIMKPVPEEIKIDPSEITVKMSDILAGYFVSANNTATIYSDSDAISIKTYSISQVTLDGEIVSKHPFKIDGGTGVVSMDLDENTTPGVYKLSFKLETAVADEHPEEGLFSDALTVNITSAPVDIIYPQDPIPVEQNGIARTSETPRVTGSQIDLSFRIIAISPEYPETGEGASADWISVDAETGAINVAQGHPFKAGELFQIDMAVTNDNGTTEFMQACQLEVVEKVDEVAGFSYEPVSVIRGVGFTAEAEMEAGDYVTYSFVELPAELSSLEINSATGAVSLEKGSPLTEGTYSVNIKAENYKGSQTAVLSIEITPNQYYFSTVSWGTNLDDAHADDPAYANQFRYPINTTSGIEEIPVKSTDMAAGATPVYSIEKLTNGAPNAKIDASTGTIIFEKTSENRRIDVYLVTVTNGQGQTGETTVRIPVFLHSAAAEGEQTVQYTPLVAKINPRTGGTTHPIEFVNISDEEKVNFHIDYRRQFGYYNLGGPASHVSNMSDPTAMSNDHHADADGNEFFLARLWYTYWHEYAQGTSQNYGSKSPMSYMANSGSYYETSQGTGGVVKNLSMPLGYVNPDRGYGVTINPRKFTYDGAWADGLFIGQIVWGIIDPVASTGEVKDEKTIETEVNGIGGAGRIFPIVIWFDPDYEN